MNDCMPLGPVPYAEDCAQLGTPGYYERARKECRAYRNQLRRVFGEPPGNASFVMKSFPHDLGSYHEICVRYDPNNEEESDFAYMCEGNLPELWDEEARKELEGA